MNREKRLERIRVHAPAATNDVYSIEDLNEREQALTTVVERGDSTALDRVRLDFLRQLNENRHGDRELL